jgi:hypothetical protein
MAIPIAECALCGDVRELRPSHFLPKALYRLLLKLSGTVRVGGGKTRLTTYQAKHYLLCADCELLFNRGGENWTLRNLYRGRGVFRLRDMVKASPAIYSNEDGAIYSAATLPPGSVEHLAYFSTSIFWRAAVRDWPLEDRKYKALSLGPFREELRKYLLGTADFPQTAALQVFISQLERPVIAFNFPESKRADDCYWHTLHVPGITFLLAVGKELARERKDFSIVQGPSHPIYLSKQGDARLQRMMLKGMGKRDPPKWAEYPLKNGVV